MATQTGWHLGLPAGSRRLLLHLLACLLSGACMGAAGAQVGPCGGRNTARLAFDFERASAIDDEPGGRGARFSAAAPVSGCPQDRMADGATRGVRLAVPRIEYEAGSPTERSAAVVADFAQPGNQVLRFTLGAPNVRTARGMPAKGRVQMNLYGNRGVDEVNQTVRMRLGPGFQILQAFPARIDWMTISEWWNNPGWGNEAYPFRISVNLVKLGAEPDEPWRLAVHAQTMNLASKKWDRTLWQQENTAFAVPVGKWVLLETRFIEGDAKRGVFSLNATPEGGATVKVFDIQGTTRHPDDPRPNGLTHWNPLKLYVGAKPIEFVQARGEKLVIDWDDLKVVGCPRKSADEKASDIKTTGCDINAPR